jgi:hypothetical protein
MITSLLIVLLLVIVTEAITEIITSSTIVAPLQAQWRIWTYPTDRPPTGIRQRIMSFVDQLWNCGYCASVWVSAVVALAAPTIFNYSIINWMVMTFVLHRLANWLHVVYELIRRGRVNSLEVVLKITEDEDGTFGQSIGEGTTTFEPEHLGPS